MHGLLKSEVVAKASDVAMCQADGQLHELSANRCGRQKAAGVFNTVDFHGDRVLRAFLMAT